MNENYFISAFGTFGNPNGFRQSYWFTNNRAIVNNIKTFDLNTNAIKIFPTSKVYAVRNEISETSNIISYSIYTYAKEKNSDRSGTFIGTSILFIDKIAEENVSINSLNEFHNNLINKNVQDDVISTDHSDNFFVSKPKDFDKISFCLKNVASIDLVQTLNNKLVVYCKTTPNELQLLLKMAIDLLNVYDTIYFTESKEVAEFVHQKKIFKLVQKDGFELEIKKFEEEKARQIQASLEKLLLEKQKLEADKKRVIEEYKQQIDLNEKQHQENKNRIEESKNELDKTNQKYEAYSKQINELANRLKTGEKLSIVEQLHHENKQIFINSVNQKQKLNFINSIPKSNIKTGIKQVTPSINEKQYFDENGNKKHYGKSQKSNTLKVTVLILFLLWIGTLVYFLVISEPKKEVIETKLPLQVQPTQKKDSIVITPNK